MKKMLIAAVCLMLLSPAHAGASLFGSDGPKDRSEEHTSELQSR